MNTVTINGVTIECEGNNISVVNNEVRVDGKVIKIEGNNYSLSSNSKLNITCDKNVTVQGDVTGDISAKGNVSCGNVVGKIEVNGSLQCGNIVGKVVK
jgi:phage baseplate assembly protein gpV